MHHFEELMGNARNENERNFYEMWFHNMYSPLEDKGFDQWTMMHREFKMVDGREVDDKKEFIRYNNFLSEIWKKYIYVAIH